jgi:flavin-dependent dehydrogenase
MSASGHTEYDVVVVGSGPAGISTAIHLTKLMPSIQNRMVVLEKASHPRKKLCGGGISAYTDDWLMRLDIKMSTTSLELNRTRFIVDHDEYMEYAVLQNGGLRTVIREEFDEALVQQARILGINVFENEPVVSFSYESDAVVVQTPKRNLSTQVLVGADGAKSSIRRELCRSLGMWGPKTACSTLRFMVRVDRSHSPEHRDLEAVIDFSLAFQRGIRGYAWSFPVLVEGQSWLNTGVGGFSVFQSKKCSLKDILIEFLATRAVSVNKTGFEAHPIRWFHPESILSANRILLVGDAAGIDPLWGEGISFSLGYGAVAANCIARALATKDFSFATYKKELLEHEVGRMLMDRLELANKLYRSNNTKDIRSLLLAAINCT